MASRQELYTPLLLWKETYCKSCTMQNYCTSAPEALDKAVDVAVERDWHYTKTEFIREAVREKLRSLGICPVELADDSHTLQKPETEDKNHD
ncbi:MAG: ribbon-helix-helix domain-containing protein [Candidatus Bathyarchaeales archaeon]